MSQGSKKPAARVLPRTNPASIEPAILHKRFKSDQHSDVQSARADMVAPDLVVSAVSSLETDSRDFPHFQAPNHHIVATFEPLAVSMPPLAVSIPPEIIKSPTDLRLLVSQVGIQVVIRQIVKKHLFQHVKFYIDREHKRYSTDPLTLCGRLLRNCYTTDVVCDDVWWDEHRQEIVRAITNRRNNVIKGIKEKFQGKSYGENTYDASH